MIAHDELRCVQRSTRITSRIQLDYPDWEWADIDGQRLVWAAGGKLVSGTMGSRGLVYETELYDFNPMKFRPLEAPYS